MNMLQLFWSCYIRPFVTQLRVRRLYVGGGGAGSMRESFDRSLRRDPINIAKKLLEWNLSHHSKNHGEILFVCFAFHHPCRLKLTISENMSIRKHSGS